MKRNKTVLYCRNLRPSQACVLDVSSPMYSRYLQLKHAGLELVIVGISDEDGAPMETAGGIKACFVNRKASGPSMAAEIRKAFPECDSIGLIIARELPVARCTLRLARALKCIAYYESLEVWTGYHVIGGKRVFPDYYRTYLRERFVIHGFHRTIAHSYPAKDYLVRLHKLPEDRIGVLYSALPIPEVEGTFPVLDSVRPSDRLLICSGALVPGRGLEEFVEGATVMPENYKLLLAGDGALKGALEQMVRDLGLEGKVLFQENIPVAMYYQLIKKADVGINFRDNRVLNYDLSMTCRVIDYINCGVPVISGVTKGFQDIEKRLGVVKCLSRGLSPQRQAEEIVRYSEEFLGDTASTARRLKHAMDTEFSFEINERRFASWLSEDGIV